VSRFLEIPRGSQVGHHTGFFRAAERAIEAEDLGDRAVDTYLIEGRKAATPTLFPQRCHDERIRARHIGGSCSLSEITSRRGQIFRP